MFFNPICRFWFAFGCFLIGALFFSRLYGREFDGPTNSVFAKTKRPVVLVVTPPVFNEALKPWVEYRQSQGFDVMILPMAILDSDGNVDWGIQTNPVATPAEIREKIVKVALEREIEAIVLVGDAAPTEDAKFGWRDAVPTARVPASVVQVFGSEELLATDSYFADLDGDGLADVPIGRFPARSPEEVTRLVNKIIRYENNSPKGNWTRRVNIFAGPNGLDLRVIGSRPGDEITGTNPLGGVSAIVDSAVNSMARKMFSEFLPQEFSLSLAQCSLQSPFCPYPPDFGTVFLERMNEGALFLIYMGHGRVLGLDRFQPSSFQDYGVFEIGDCANLKSERGAPIALFFACYTGAYDANCQCLAEEVAVSSDGPVAVYAASRLTAPYGMCVLGYSLMLSAFESDLSGMTEQKTLGRIVLEAQKKALSPPESTLEDRTSDDGENFDETLVFDDEVSTPEPEIADSFEDTPLDKLNARLEKSLRDAEEFKQKNASFRVSLDRWAAILDPTASKLEEQIKDHVLEFNLFGDPLLRVKLPQRVRVEAPDIAYSSDEITVSTTVPNLNDRESLAQVELLPADFRSTVRKPKRARSFVESTETAKEYRETYRKANLFVVDAVRGKTLNGRLEMKILVPKDYSGESVVRVAAFDGLNYYIGAKRILVRPRSEQASAE